MVDVNISAYLKLSHKYLALMKKRNRGAAIFTSSLNALSPLAKSAVYTATKAFELYFGCALSHELRDTKIDILNLMAGPTRTGFQKKAKTHEASWIKDPFELAEEALNALGEKMTYIPDDENQILAGVLGRFEFEDRTKISSELLEKTLLKGEL